MNQNENMDVELTLTEENESSTAMYDLSPEDFDALVANATELQLEVDKTLAADTCVCCPERAEHWFKLTVLQSGNYSFSAEVCVGVRLYDAERTRLTSDNESGEKNNFLINCALTQGQVYYLRVMPKLNHFLRFDTTIVGTVVPVTSVSIPRYTLFLLPGTAGDIPVTILPQNATNKQLIWSSSNTEIVTVDSNGTVLAATNQIGQAYITAKSFDGNHEAVIEVGVGVFNGNFRIINKASNRFLSVEGEYVTKLDTRPDVVCNAEDDSNVQIWEIKPIAGTSKFRINSFVDVEYALNIDTGDSRCNVIPSSGNTSNSTLSFLHIGQGYYKIKMESDHNKYLTANSETNGAGVTWAEVSNSDLQKWYFGFVDMERREAEKVEYHLIPYSDIDLFNKRALQVDMNTPNDNGRVNKTYRLAHDEPLELATFSYVNKQKWLITGIGSECKIYTPHGDNYCLCKQEGREEVYVSNKSTVESFVTVNKYNNSNDLIEIKLTASELYLTLRDEKIIWAAYNNTNHSTQVWKKEGPLSNLHNGCSTKTNLTNDTVRALKCNSEEFVIRYYGIVSSFNDVDILTVDKKTGQSLISETLSKLSGQEILWENEDFDYLQYVDQLFEVNEAGEIIQLANITYMEKTITPTELKNIKEQGLKVVVVYQNFGNDDQHFTTNHAKLDAFCALVDAKRIGQPYGSTIYFAVDFDATDMDQITAYFNTVKKAINGRYQIGVYGSGLVCKTIKEKCDVPYAWLCKSTDYVEYSDYDTTSKFNIKQAEDIVYNDVTFDDDVAIDDNYGQWIP